MGVGSVGGRCVALTRPRRGLHDGPGASATAANLPQPPRRLLQPALMRDPANFKPSPLTPQSMSLRPSTPSHKNSSNINAVEAPTGLRELEQRLWEFEKGGKRAGWRLSAPVQTRWYRHHR